MFHYYGVIRWSHPSDVLAQAKTESVKTDICFNWMTSFLSPLFPNHLSCLVYKDLHHLWQQKKKVEKKFLILSDHQQPGYRSSYYLERDSHWISCHFDVSSTSASNFVFLLISFYSFISSVTVVEQTSEVKTKMPVVVGLTLFLSFPSSHTSTCPLLFPLQLNCLWPSTLSPINCFLCNTAFLSLYLLTAGRLTSALCLEYPRKPTLLLSKNSVKKLRKSLSTFFHFKTN